jgi:endonuclease-3
MNDEKRKRLFDRLAEVIPEPATELRYATPFELLVAVVLSAQATDKGVNKATAKLFPVANTPEAILALGEEGLKKYIKTIGLFNGKAANIVGLCRLLVERHGGEVPNTRAELEALPGVGRKTANVILNTAFGQPTIAVDTHIFRVANRTRLAIGKTVLEVEKMLERHTPKAHKLDAHHLLILHGRYTCVARKPRCGSCAIEDLCEYPDKTEAD